jgi:haloalkane dehalogenase
MEILRTPDKCFENIKGYTFNPVYTNITAKDGTKIRVHHIDEGPRDGPILLAMHGQPVWSYLYSKMIPILNESGIRVIAPDLVGYGKSDKPSEREDYSYQNQVDWMNEWMINNNLKDLTFFGQDWGGLIGLRMIADNPDRFNKVSIGNTGLPYSPNTSDDVIQQVNEFRQSKLKLTPMSMAKQIKQMDSGKTHPALKFMYWQKFCWDTKNLPVGLINSIMMEKNSKIGTFINYIMHVLGIAKISPYFSDLMAAYEAPFPNYAYKMGCRAMPSHVPIIPDISLEAQKKAREFFYEWDKPFLSIFAGNDPVTNAMEQDVLNMVPNAKSAPNIGGGHFFQWTKPKELSKVISDFIMEKI